VIEAGLFAAENLAIQERKQFFFEKKNQKTFVIWAYRRHGAHLKSQEFLLLFSKRSAFFLPTSQRT
jgi:hypothetical protein